MMTKKGQEQAIKRYLCVSNSGRTVIPINNEIKSWNTDKRWRRDEDMKIGKVLQKKKASCKIDTVWMR